MAIQAPVPATPFGPAPNINDPDNFDDLMDARLEQEGVFGDQMNALGQNVFNNATEAQARALQAQQAAADAASAASAAAASTTAVKWTAGTYGDGVVTWSPTSRFSYRHIGSGASAIDPALDPGSWVLQLYALGLGGMSITGSVDLIVTSGGAIFVTPATPGLYITLPDATTLTQGAIAFHAFNAGVHDMGVRNKAGVVLGWIRPGSSSVIGLASNAMVAGVWVASNLHKLGVTAQLNVPSVSPNFGNLGQTIKRVTIDTTRTLFLFGALYAVVYDNSTLAWGAPALIRSGGPSAISAASATLVATDKVLVVSTGVSLEAVILSLSGTAISPNAVVSATTAGASGISEIVTVGSAFAFGLYGNGGSSQVRAITISGTVPAIGAEVTFGDKAMLPTLFVSGSVLRVVGLNGGVSNGNVTCTPYTISGATLAAGTSANNGAGVGASQGISGLRCFQNGNGNIVAFSNAGSVNVTVFKLTGTTETASSTPSGMVADNAQTNIDYVQISGTKTAIASSSAGVIYWNVHTDNAGTGTCGSSDSMTFSGGLISAVGASGSSARFAIYGAVYNGQQLPPTQLQFDCSGASPVRGNCHSRWSVNTPRGEAGGKAPRHFSVLTAGNNQYAIGGNNGYDGIFNSNGVQAMPSLGENLLGGVIGAAANDSWILSGLSSGGLTFGTTIKHVEAAA